MPRTPRSQLQTRNKQAETPAVPELAFETRNDDPSMALLQELPLPAFLADQSGVILLGNAKLLELNSRAVGKPWFFSISPETAAASSEDWAKAIQNKAEFRQEIRFRNDEGEFENFLLNASKLVDSLYSLVCLTPCSQILRQHQEKIVTENQRTELERIESLEILAGGVAHHFNNLLTGILGNVAFAKEQVIPESMAAGLLQRVELAVDRAAELCRNLLAYSGGGQFQSLPTDLNQIARQSARILQPLLPDSIEMAFKLDYELPLVQGDGAKLRDAVSNLLTNAVEALEDRPGNIWIRTGSLIVGPEIDSEGWISKIEPPPGHYAYVEIEDNGPGIPPKVFGRIFDPFFTTKFVGRGLGLSFSQGLLSAHGGVIQTLSKPGEGTRFRMLIPASRVEEPGIPVSASNSRLPRRLLVAHARTASRAKLEAMLEILQIETKFTRNSHDALKLFKQDPEFYPVVLLSVSAEGDEVLRAFRALNPAVRIVMSVEAGEPYPSGNSLVPDKLLHSELDLESLRQSLETPITSAKAKLTRLIPRPPN